MSGAPLLGLPEMDDAERDVTWPLWLGAGIAFKPNDKLTFTADAQYTDWKEMDILPINFSNAGWQLFFKEGADLTLRWDSKVQVRFGVEYKVSPSFALRGGYYYDPSPSPKATMNILLPELSYNFFTIGFGYKTNKINLDVCLEYAFGKEVEVGLLEAEPGVGMPGFHNMNILVPNISLTIKL
jgi:long-chain fatty acid transport protein